MNEVFRFGPFSLNPVARTLRKGGSGVVLGSRAFDILAALVEGEGKVLTRRELMACAWPGLVVEESNVRVQIAHLRKAMGCGHEGARFIASVAGRGYCLTVKVTREQASEPPSRRLEPGVVPRAERAQSPSLANTSVTRERIIGREESIDELTAQVLQHRLVTIVGAAGMGKTTVAVLAARSLTSFGDSIHFVDLGLIVRADQVLEALSSAAGYRPSGSVTLAGLTEFLDARPTLVVLDNCEHVIADAALLCRQVLDQTSRVAIVCTSREALRLFEEHVYLLPSLASPPNTGKLTAEQATAWPAVQLFVERAEECGALDVLSDESAPTIAATCRRLDGNPLAIELVASRVGTYGVQGVSELLATQTALHWRGRRDAAPRHQTVEALLDWTYELLPERHRLALRRLSAFSGGFTLESAIAVISDGRLDAGQAAAAISDLADKSLVSTRTVSGRMRLRLLETTRVYAATKLAADGESDATARRHALYYADYLRSREAALELDPGASPELRDDELNNVRAALDWCFSTPQDAALAMELSALAVPSFLQHRSFDECVRSCTRALAHMPPQLQSTTTELVLREALSIAYASMGLYGDDMVLALRSGLEISQALQDNRATFHLSAGLHLAMLGFGRFEESMRVARQYASLASHAGNATEAVIACWMIGASHHFIGEHSAAEDQFAIARRELAHASLRRLQYFDSKARLNASLGMARTKLALGLSTQALQLSMKTIDESRGYPDSLFPCATLFFPILLWNNRERMAEALLKQLQDVSPEYRVGSRPANIEMLEGLLLQRKERFPEAEAQLRRCLPGVRISAARLIGLQAMAEVLRMNAKPDEALAFVEQAITLADTSGGQYSLPDLLRVKGEIMVDLPQFSEPDVREHFSEVLRRAEQAGALGWEIGIALAFARFEASRGRPQEAKTLLHGVYSRFAEGFQTRPLQDAARMLEAL